MRDDFQILVVFDPKIILETKFKAHKIIYSKNPDEKKKTKIIEKLEKKAAEDSLKFNRRRLSSLFTPVFGGCILFPGETDLITEDVEEFIDFGDLFFGEIEKYFGISVVNYNLIDFKKKAGAAEYMPNFFDFEIFNYNFDTHKAVKSEFVKIPRIKKLNEIAQAVMKKKASSPALKPVKKTAKLVKEKSSGKEKTAGIKTAVIKKSGNAGFNAEPAKTRTAKSKLKKPVPREEISTGEISGICAVESTDAVKNIGEQIGMISLNWRLLSPAESVPVLETGEPVEIGAESSVRIYFQKPSVRQVTWRFRKKSEFESSKAILRVYRDDDMLWYEVLDGPFGSRYIIFPEGLELAQTWVEIGYLTDKGDFIFIARSPAWPPVCLRKKLPKLKLERKLPKDTVLIGATENIPGGRRLPVNITSSGAGFSGSGAGIDTSGAQK